jgi:hypothetical protein
MPATFATLPEQEKEAWLVQHVPHRICAALTWLEVPGRWAMPTPPNMPKTGDFHVWCIGRSVDEGHLASMRWLIEFIGVTLDGKGVPVPPRPHPNGKSVTIEQVGGAMFSLADRDALLLAKVWQACSQASLHPTTDTNHLPVGFDTLAKALGVVIAHLEVALYAPKNRDLWQIVRDQERFAIERGKSGISVAGAGANVFVRYASP